MVFAYSQDDSWKLATTSGIVRLLGPTYHTRNVIAPKRRCVSSLTTVTMPPSLASSLGINVLP